MQKLHTVSIMYQKLKITETELEVRTDRLGTGRGIISNPVKTLHFHFCVSI